MALYAAGYYVLYGIGLGTTTSNMFDQSTATPLTMRRQRKSQRLYVSTSRSATFTLLATTTVEQHSIHAQILLTRSIFIETRPQRLHTLGRASETALRVDDRAAWVSAKPTKHFDCFCIAPSHCMSSLSLDCAPTWFEHLKARSQRFRFWEHLDTQWSILTVGRQVLSLRTSQASLSELLSFAIFCEAIRMSMPLMAKSAVSDHDTEEHCFTGPLSQRCDHDY